MKKLVFLLILSFSSLSHTQDFIKQITHIDNDARNFKFLKTNPFGWGELSEYVFESHSDSAVNVSFGYYNPEIDLFYNQEQLTNNFYKNINPTGRNFYGNNSLLIYQTDQNGNWDLVLRTRSNNIWNEEQILFDSQKDETKPLLFKDDDYYYSEDSVQFLYGSDNSVFLACWQDSITHNQEIFAGNDSTIYTSYDAAFFWIGWSDPRTGHYIVAQKNRPGMLPQLVYRQKKLNGVLGPETILLESPTFRNPGFSEINFHTHLHYEDTINGKRNVLFFEGWPWSTENPTPLKSNPDGDLSDFTSAPIYIITKEDYTRKVNDLPVFECHSFKQISNDSTFIRVNLMDFWWHLDTLLFTSVSDTRIDVSEAGMNLHYFVFYTTWEDSIDGRIGILGRKHLFDASSVDDDRANMAFHLYQNYPNPFNPSTTIKYSLSKPELVIIKIFDVLGNEIQTIVNKEHSAGDYSINFNGAKLSCGIYFYRMQSGSSFQTKKMILIK